jgi:DNA-binding PadR family transcriptional regulator
MKIMRNRREFPEASVVEPERFLPLRPGVLALLAVLSEGARPGVQILARLDEIDCGILGPGTLYRLLRELRQQGLIERVEPPEGTPIEDDRQSFHGLSPLGSAVLEAESARLRRTLAVTRSARSGRP